MDILDSLETDSYNGSVYSWFLNQEHIPFGLSSNQYRTLFYEFITKELYNKYKETNHNHYWFQKGKLLSTTIIEKPYKPHQAYNYITINKTKLRNIILDEILN